MDNGPTEQLNYEEMYNQLKADYDATVPNLQAYLLNGLVYISFLLGIATASIENFDAEVYYEWQEDVKELI